MPRNRSKKDIGKRLFIELGTPLQVLVQGVGASLSGELIGMEVGKYIIVKIMGLNGVSREQLEQSAILVKYLQVNEIFGFKTKIMRFLRMPEELAFLEYPSKVENYNLRSLGRTSCYLPVKVELEHNLVSGVIVDINSQGCRCKIKNFTMVKNQGTENIVMFLQITNLGKKFQLLGHVRSIRRNKEEISLGIMFDNVDVFTQTAIRSIVPTLELQNKQVP